MSALPKQVRAQVERANKLAAEYQQQLTPGSKPGGEPSTEKIIAPTPPPNPTPDPTPPPPQDPPDPTAAKVTPLPTEDPDHKYKVLQGKYNAEVPRLQTQNREQAEAIRNLQQQLTATQNLLASLSEQQKSAPAQTPAAPVPTKLIKDEERREFGDDLIDVMRRAAREEFASLLPEVDRRVAPVAQRVDQTVRAVEQVGARVAQNDQQTVHSLLDSAVPNWLELNNDAGFVAWLDQHDPYAGRPRGVMLREAYRTHDGPRVVEFFKGYLKEHAVVTPQPTPTPAAAAPAPQRKLEQLVAPGTAKPGTTSTPDGSGKRVWTRAEISKFYADVQAGRFKGTAEQRKAMERDIFAAQSEGRIR